MTNLPQNILLKINKSLIENILIDIQIAIQDVSYGNYINSRLVFRLRKLECLVNTYERFRNREILFDET